MTGKRYDAVVIQKKLFSLLEPGADLNITLTEAHQMVPEHSISFLRATHSVSRTEGAQDTFERILDAATHLNDFLVSPDALPLPGAPPPDQGWKRNSRGVLRRGCEGDGSFPGVRTRPREDTRG